MNSHLTWDDVADKFMNFEDDACKCFSCGGWFPTEDCVINHDEDKLWSKGTERRPAEVSGGKGEDSSK